MHAQKHTLLGVLCAQLWKLTLQLLIRSGHLASPLHRPSNSRAYRLNSTIDDLHITSVRWVFITRTMTCQNVGKLSARANSRYQTTFSNFVTNQVIHAWWRGKTEEPATTGNWIQVCQLELPVLWQGEHSISSLTIKHTVRRITQNGENTPLYGTSLVCVLR